jgi:anti-sigma regulatory factor (Ser/Thr protein kinase)
VRQYGDRLGARAEQQGRAELVVTELVTNLIEHADPGGWILVRPLPPRSIEIISVDHGPGIKDPAAALDGLTPGPHGLGRGLAAVRRLSSRFDIFSEPDSGTTVLAIVDLDAALGDPPDLAPRRWAGVSIGLNEACGDGWAVAEREQQTALAVVDGLGHGVYASAAADAALAAFALDPADLDGYLTRANPSMRGTRGGAVALCRLQPRLGVLHYLAVGNISGRILCGREERGLISLAGTVGLKESLPRGKVFSYPWPPGATLVVWTDGLTGRLDLSNAGELLDHDPGIAAATLHRDHSRERDDATVVVVRNDEAP